MSRSLLPALFRVCARPTAIRSPSWNLSRRRALLYSTTTTITTNPTPPSLPTTESVAPPLPDAPQSSPPPEPSATADSPTTNSPPTTPTEDPPAKRPAGPWIIRRTHSNQLPVYLKKGRHTECARLNPTTGHLIFKGSHVEKVVQWLTDRGF
ncbi:hypothetical protein XA68_17914 [Ophiocordyceps unilateralis]|uniref:Uncharacterized protein n=1 Tax=Ophiocordyceps unilateralis TaxID=268505 RepID=A0A2A9P3R7_OPHUN|nr:hypothetical protein XA68_17914 [Ophiocordyceps unilateralis]